MQTFYAYTDGSCKRNPGPGAAALVITSPEGTILKEFVKAFPQTTNNRMELTAVIAALKAVPNGELVIFADSQYVLNGIKSWMRNWKRNGWLTAAKKPVENKDLWLEIDALIAAHEGPLKWEWVRGHNGTPGNERADTLAQEAAMALVR